MTRKGYPSDVCDDEWAFVAPYLTLMREDAPQREHSLREVFNGLRYIVRTGMQCGFVLLPRRWVVERSFAWMARFRRLARDYERLSQTLVRLHFVAFAILMAHRFVTCLTQSA